MQDRLQETGVYDRVLGLVLLHPGLIWQQRVFIGAFSRGFPHHREHFSVVGDRCGRPVKSSEVFQKPSGALVPVSFVITLFMEPKGFSQGRARRGGAGSPAQNLLVSDSLGLFCLLNSKLQVRYVPESCLSKG